jgi:GT2 family glycosyltransferase
MPLKPRISIVMPTYNPAAPHLRAAVESVRRQLYANWELCIADDASTAPHVRPILIRYAALDDRIRLRLLKANSGIANASNAALSMATGEFVALLDHDDELAEAALWEVVKVLNSYPNTDMVYSDEDKLSPDGWRCEPFFKPDWSPTTFLSYMYTCHLGVYRRSLLDRIGGFRGGLDGGQDYDLVLRVTEHTSNIRHIPKILYHWRKTPQSTAADPLNKRHVEHVSCLALTEAMQRRGLAVRKVEVGLAPTTYRVRFRIPDGLTVHIIIPTRNNHRCLRRCVRSLLEKTEYQDYCIHVVDNGSDDTETLDYLDSVQREPRLRVLHYDRPFNFSAINNWAISQIDGRYLLLLNDDTEVIAPGWLDAMLEHAQRPEVGAVGAKLVYADGRIQHGGVILGIGGVAGHAHKFFPADHPGYFSRLQVVQNLSAVTAACMLTRRDVFERAGSFNEKDLAVAFNDVDFCLRVREAGYQIIYTPFAELYHEESVSRGFNLDGREVRYMEKTWHTHLKHDPFYNPNLTLDREDFSLHPRPH